MFRLKQSPIEPVVPKAFGHISLSRPTLDISVVTPDHGDFGPFLGLLWLDTPATLC